MTKPNLFAHATSELSQDAFICWLLEWAHPERAHVNNELHSCGIALIKAFFNKHSLPVPTHFENIKVEKQFKHIDVLCTINDKYPIIIEDKTHTGAHSGQLKKYYEKISASEDFDACNIIPIYFKTYDQSNYKKIRDDGYREFTRKDFLEILDRYINTGSDIYESFRSHLHTIENQVQSYLATAEGTSWTGQQWTGLFMALQKSLRENAGEEANWNYIPNPSGGFMGFWWHFDTVDDIRSYLQLENNKLVFKLSAECPKKMKRIRTRWHSIIQRISDERHIPVMKPIRFGSGQSITVAVLKRDYRTFTEDTIDLEATVNTLILMQRLLDSARTEFINEAQLDVEAPVTA